MPTLDYDDQRSDQQREKPSRPVFGYLMPFISVCLLGLIEAIWITWGIAGAIAILVCVIFGLAGSIAGLVDGSRAKNRSGSKTLFLGNLGLFSNGVFASARPEGRHGPRRMNLSAAASS
jgi:hypothetical protein